MTDQNDDLFLVIPVSVNERDVAAIVPAYNEAGRIGKVITVLHQVDLLNEIIVVDDGSTDQTMEEAHRSACGDRRLHIIHHSNNQGKGQAMYTGWKATEAPILLFLDADLINLNTEHVIKLMRPVLCDQADITMGLFKQGYWRTDWSHWLTPWLTGQRCLRSDLLKSICWKAAAGYGFETALTIAARKHKWRCKRVSMDGVSHPLGEIPRGGWHGPGLKIKMYAQIVRAWWIYRNSDD